MDSLKKGQMMYYARIMPTLGLYDVYDCKVITVADTWFSAMEKRNKRTFIFNFADIGKTVFENRLDALEKVTEAESRKGEFNVSDETYYEED